jgi:hypothetical protein
MKVVKARGRKGINEREVRKEKERSEVDQWIGSKA